MGQLFWACFTIAAAVFGCAAYYYLANRALDLVFPDTGKRAAANIDRAGAVRPWLFLFPAIAVLGLYLVYPVAMSVWLSFRDADGTGFVGVDNYVWLAGDPTVREALRNTALWLVVVPAAATFLGLVAAALTDRIRWRGLAQSLIILPMAISFVGASVIWKFVYEYRAAGQDQIGLLNAVMVGLGHPPEAWLTLPLWNNFFLMVVMIWIQTGFAMVILSAALRGLPEETIEAAVLDGATPLQIFTRIKVPQIRGTIAVVWTTITVLVLKVFDIVLAMTNGQWGSQVLANLMFDWMFRGGDVGRASTVALVIMVLVAPVMIWNIRNARREGW